MTLLFITKTTLVTSMFLGNVLRNVRCLFFQEHKNVCNYRVVTCIDCGSKMLERHFNTHQTTECPFRAVLCRHCGEDFIAHFLEVRTVRVLVHIK